MKELKQSLFSLKTDERITESLFIKDRRVFNTPSNIHDGTFSDGSYCLLVVNSFDKKLHYRCLTGSKYTFDI